MTSSTTKQRTPPRAHPSKVSVAYDSIRARIVDGAYPPGTRLVLDRLARELDMSTLPVREAIRRLEAEGYVQFQQNVGATVAAFDSQSFIQAVETMAVLESAATAQAAPHITKQELAAAKTLNDAMASAIDALDGVAYAAAHDEFHALLTSACPNKHLIRMVSQERSRLQRVRQAALAMGAGGRREVEEHEELLRLIESGAPADEIEDLSRAHTIAVTAVLARSVEPRDATSG
jgi:DNA-binding GntR family transcriptional regulator